VVGIDIAGGPSTADDHRLADYAAAFGAARDMELGRTVHAGEGRPAEEIRVAVETLHAQRIGHGCSLLEDRRVVDLVLARGVTIEACPTSNVHTGVIAAVERHPMAEWLRLGVRVCVCTDNTLLSDVDLPRELANAARIEGMTPELVARMIDHGHAAAFHR
jgi:adenosine deaminase